MRVTQVLRAQHLGFMFKKHWIVQGKRVPRDSGAQNQLQAQGIEVLDAMEFVKPVVRMGRIDVVGYMPEAENMDESHRLWKARKCYTYGDTNVLLEGLQQAQVITKTIAINGLPQNIEQLLNSTKIPTNTETFVKNSILSSHVFDAQQEKTAKLKDPNRPAYVLPRVYGITDFRRNRLILSKMLFECEKLAGRTTASGRKIINDVQFNVPFDKDDDLFKIDVKTETFMTSKKAISPIEQEFTGTQYELPNLFPMKHTISMPHTNIYKLQDIYPMLNGCAYASPHTICLHFSPLEVQNLHGTKVSEAQIKGRSLMKAFAVAAASARSQYGATVKDLPTPIVVQSVHTDGKSFYFGVFQCNTLNLSGTTGLKNYWFNVPIMDLFSECSYRSGRPILLDYNNDVIKYMYAFYRNT